MVPETYEFLVVTNVHLMFVCMAVTMPMLVMMRMILSVPVTVPVVVMGVAGLAAQVLTGNPVVLAVVLHFGPAVLPLDHIDLGAFREFILHVITGSRTRACVQRGVFRGPGVTRLCDTD